MMIADRAHLNDFAVNEFHTIVFMKDAGLPHAVILLHGEKLLRNLSGHSVHRSHSIVQFPGFCTTHVLVQFKRLKKPTLQANAANIQEKRSAFPRTSGDNAGWTIPVEHDSKE